MAVMNFQTRPNTAASGQMKQEWNHGAAAPGKDAAALSVFFPETGLSFFFDKYFVYIRCFLCIPMLKYENMDNYVEEKETTDIYKIFVKDLRNLDMGMD